MLNNQKIKPSSSLDTYQKFFKTNFFSTSKDKPNTNIPKNIAMYSNAKEAVTKSQNLKSLTKKNSIGNYLFNIGNRLININYSEKQPNNTSENKLYNIKRNLNNNVRYSHNIDHYNQFNKNKFETEAHKISDFDNDNIYISIPYENNNEQKESITKHNSITYRTNNKSSFREFNTIKAQAMRGKDENIVNNNLYSLLEEKDKEIERLKNELIQMKNNLATKPTNFSNDSRLTENFYNSNSKSLSTSNKNNQNNNFKFDVKSLSSNKIDLLAERSANSMKANKNNVNQYNTNSKINNNNNNNNLTNRNSFSSKNFMEVFNHTKKNSYITNNLSKSTNFNTIKYADKRSNSKLNINPRNFSSTFSNFFRKSNSKVSTNLNGNTRYIPEIAKSSRNLVSSSNQNMNSSSNNNSLNKNSSINAQRNSNKDNESNSLNNKNYYIQINSEKPLIKKHFNFENSNESNEITSNFSDFINLDRVNFNKNSRTIENYINNERMKNKRSSQLEIKDVEYNEDDFKRSSLKDNEKQAFNKGKSISSLFAKIQNEKIYRNFHKSNSLHNDFFIKRSPFNFNADNDTNIFDKLSELKSRTKYVLNLYAENLLKTNDIN